MTKGDLDLEYIDIDLYPQLRSITWWIPTRPSSFRISGADALSAYQRNWSYVDQAALSSEELALIKALTRRFGQGVIVDERADSAQIEQILPLFNHDLLFETDCQLAGDFAMAMLTDWQRKSREIEFLTNSDQFCTLRSKIHDSGVSVLFKHPLSVVREQFDQSRILLIVASPFEPHTLVRTQISLEGRIKLEPALRSRALRGVSFLGKVDLIAEKLLAIVDSGSDSRSFTRELIDLAVLSVDRSFVKGWAKAESAYSSAIGDGVEKAKLACLEQEGWLQHCISTMHIKVSEHDLRERILRLGSAGLVKSI